MRPRRSAGGWWTGSPGIGGSSLSASRWTTWPSAAALTGKDVPGIQAVIDGVAAARERVLDGLGRLGLSGARLEAETVRIDDAILALREELSRVEDVVIAEAVMALALHEAGYEAALAAFARARQSSLLDFLR